MHGLSAPGLQRGVMSNNISARRRSRKLRLTGTAELISRRHKISIRFFILKSGIWNRVRLENEIRWILIPEWLKIVFQMSWVSDLPKQPGSKQKQKQKQKLNLTEQLSCIYYFLEKNWQAIRKCPRTFFFCRATT